MYCPRCSADLVVVEYDDIELDWCPSCEGLWFDRGEMELAATRMGPTGLGLTFERPAQTSEQSLQCPLCRVRMNKRLLGNPGPVQGEPRPIIADMCPQCGGIWLDRGELDQALSPQGGTGTASPVAAHLRTALSALPTDHSTRASSGEHGFGAISKQGD
jgi:Zn-finger nucleic acid-binding protein